MCNCCIFIIWPFNDGINWTGFLTISAINAFCHVNIISSCSSRPIRSWLTLNCDSSCWTCSCAQLTSDASFLSCGISSQGMFSSKFWRKWSFFIRIMYSPFRFETIQKATVEKRIEVFRHNNLN